MKDLNFEQMQKMQIELRDKYKDKWPAIEPLLGRELILWMMIEAGEVADFCDRLAEDYSKYLDLSQNEVEEAIKKAIDREIQKN